MVDDSKIISSKNNFVIIEEYIDEIREIYISFLNDKNVLEAYLEVDLYFIKNTLY